MLFLRKLRSKAFFCFVLATAMILQSGNTLAEKKYADDFVSQELKVDQVSFRYNSVDGSIWETCAVSKAKQAHDFNVICGRYRFTAHVLFRIWQASEGSSAEEKTYDLLIIADRHESDGAIISALQSTWLELASGGAVKKIKADIGFDNSNNILQATVRF